MAQRRLEPALARPPTRIEAGDGVVLRVLRPEDVPALHTAIVESFPDLHRWLPWAGELPPPSQIESYVRNALVAFDAGESFSYGIGADDAGDRKGVLEIGYWVHSAWTGRGIATAAARALTDAAFALPGIARVEIHCDETNGASASVPPKLGYRLATVVERPPRTPGETGREQVWAIEGQ
jgi:RimJ/RimL family protein N-acetyltransferase